METQDLELRYDDRVLGFHAFINTDRDYNKLALDIQRAAKGPKIDASIAWLEGYNDGAAAWALMCSERQIPNNFELRYGRKVLAFHVYVNSESDPYHIHKVILRIARGERLDVCVCWAETFVNEDGRKIWAELQKAAVKTAADPRAKTYSFEDPPVTK